MSMDKEMRIKQLEEDLQRAREKIDELETANIKFEAKTNRSLSNNIFDLKESVIDNIHHPLVILDDKLKVVFANKYFLKTFKISSEEVQDTLIYEVKAAQWDIPQLKTVLETILPSNSRMTNFEMQVEGNGGTEKHLLLNASEIQLSGTDSNFILLSIENITKRKIAQNNLKKSQQQFRDLFYSTTSLIAIFHGPDHVVDMANDAIVKVWGKGKEVIGKPIVEILPEIEDQGLVDLLNRVYSTGEPFHAVEKPIAFNIDGVIEERYFDILYQPQRDSNGNIIGVANISSDVTKQALLNEQIKKSETDFRQLVNFMPHKISIAGLDSKVKFYNQSWLDYVGLNLKEFLERPWLDIIHPEDKERISKEVAQHLSNGESLETEIRLLNKKGDYLWHLCRSNPLKDVDGKIYSWLTSSTEIQKLKDDEKRKESFLKLVSHELKTPVTSIKGYIQLLQSILPENVETDSKNIPVKPYLHRIESQIERLIRLISEMLDLSRIEQNELILELSDFQLNEQIETVVEDLSFSYREMQIDINHMDQISVNADRERIGQVITNLITNAVKYSPDAKKVSIRIFKTDENQAAVSVKDYGIGIALQEQQQIFKRFYRVSGNKDETYEGFGIGLYLSNEIIEKHQGKIVVKSEPGKGSEFTFILPLK